MIIRGEDRFNSKIRCERTPGGSILPSLSKSSARAKPVGHKDQVMTRADLHKSVLAVGDGRLKNDLKKTAM